MLSACRPILLPGHLGSNFNTNGFIPEIDTPHFSILHSPYFPLSFFLARTAASLSATNHPSDTLPRFFLSPLLSCFLFNQVLFLHFLLSFRLPFMTFPLLRSTLPLTYSLLIFTPFDPPPFLICTSFSSIRYFTILHHKLQFPLS